MPLLNRRGFSTPGACRSAAQPPGPRPQPIQTLANLRALRRDMLGFFRQLHDTYGPVVQFKVPGRRVVLLSDPAAIEKVFIADAGKFTKSRILKLSKPVLGEGLLTSEGEHHLRQRRMIQPVFRRAHLARYAESMSRCSAELSTRWHDKQTVDMAQQMMRLALLIAGQTLFGADVTDDVDRIDQALSTTRRHFNRLLLPMAHLLRHLPLPGQRADARAIAELDAVIYRLIAERRERVQDDAGDLLSLLLRARDEDDGGQMTDKQVRDEALTLLLAGHETTAVALSWTWWLLSQHPEVEAALHAELDAVLAGRAATYEDLPRLDYTRRVLAESMRLCPPAYTVGRTPIEDYHTGGYVIRAGSQLLMSQYVVHRHAGIFAQPDAFKPERWSEAFRSALPRFAYFPFGGGPRTCIGEHFAWTEATLALATLAQHWRPRLVPGHPVAFEPQITLRPKHGLRMTLHRRSAAR